MYIWFSKVSPYFWLLNHISTASTGIRPLSSSTFGLALPFPLTLHCYLKSKSLFDSVYGLWLWSYQRVVFCFVLKLPIWSIFILWLHFKIIFVCFIEKFLSKKYILITVFPPPPCHADPSPSKTTQIYILSFSLSL